MTKRSNYDLRAQAFRSRGMEKNLVQSSGRSRFIVPAIEKENMEEFFRKQVL